jgi:SAM-dependent methyltransferase
MEAMTIYSSVRGFLGTAKRAALAQRNRFRTNGDIFDGIYANANWGGKPGDISSGYGSDGEIADSYVDAVVTFLRLINCASVVDIGCGDFRIGSKIAFAIPKYTGVDVSRIVIDRNKSLHNRDGVSFEVCDAEHDTLPPGDVCLIRQVLQHLSNRSIKKILDRLVMSYQYVVITEHLPARNAFRAFNLDKPTGGDVRPYFGSGVYVDQPPFNVSVDRVLLDLPLTKEQSAKTNYSSADPDSWEFLKTVVVRGAAKGRGRQMLS